jgi:Mg-chelatase subunit ChlD
MSGRHLPPSSSHNSPSADRFSVSRKTVLVGAAALTAVALGAAAFAVARPGHHDAAAAGSHCASPVTLNVVASPSIAASVRTVADQWVANHPSVAGRCVSVNTAAVADATTEAAIVDGSESAAMWVPDSSVWVQRLATDLQQASVPPAQVRTYSSIASSPLTVVAPVSQIARQGNVAPSSILQSAITGSVPLTIADPVNNADGLLGLLAMRTMIGTSSAQTDAELMGLMVRLAHQAVPSATAAVQAMSSPSAAGALPVVASEQTAIAENSGKAQPVVGAIYPNGGSMSLDYPVVSLSHGSDDAGLAPALDQFQRILHSIPAQQVFATAGFRDPAGDPLDVLSGLGSNNFTPIAAPKAIQTEAMLRAWSAAGTNSHTLAVIDTSGSMADDAGNGKSKIQLAAAATAEATEFFPDSSSFGLWSFSGGTGAATPWTVLRPVEPLGDRTADGTQRNSLAKAAQTLPSTVGGSTALYDTALAAYSQIRNSYVPGAVNSVVLLTDGQDDYPQGMTLDTLLARLRSLADASHPVPIITIGVGNQADIPVLRQISALTGGKTYVVKNPSDIQGVFLDAMLQRQCRPNCSMSGS